jgi:hypothetical protein
VEQSLTVDDVRRAEALAVVNSLRGWRPAELLAEPAAAAPAAVLLSGSTPG